MAQYAICDVRKTEAYSVGKRHFRRGMAMTESDACPYQMGSGSNRQGWMSGFFDAYFQALCDKYNWGVW